MITRFAPSPTGLLHVGNIRTAVLNWLAARQEGGTFILRIDDTDPERSSEEFADAIRRDLDWLGLSWDREERQSARLDLYRATTERLRATGRLYECFETPRELEAKRRAQEAAHRPPIYDREALMLTNADRERLRRTRGSHWRFLLEHRATGWDDLIRGPQSIDAGSLSDPVLIRGDGQVLYTLASVVDDADMGVTHVVRGADHVTNTAAQIQIFEALRAAPPAFGHHSLLVGPEGGPLSKRLGAVPVAELREQGVEPLALLSFMARLGSSQPVGVVTDVAELIAGFDLGRFGASPTRFDAEELGQHSARTLRALPLEAVAGRLGGIGVPDAVAPRFWAAIGPNLERFDEAAEWWALCHDGARPALPDEDRAYVQQALAMLPPRPWDETTWKTWTASVKAATGRKGKALYLPLRRALTGRDTGPEMAALMPLLQMPQSPSQKP
ncbi:MAG TPA: glutamate--tRNA ligase [Paracoccaceae bacterium]|nr:glutamate--tRNA ligase [Paracoccaceae bacterium]